MVQYEYLKAITFYVNPDQISLLITGAEYHNSSTSYHPITTAFGTGSGQLAAVFDDVNTPRAAITAMCLIRLKQIGGKKSGIMKNSPADWKRP
jgi:hypothetical protein